MTPLHRDPHFTFRFGDDWLISRFHLDGVPPETRVTVFALDSATGDRRGVLAKAAAGDGGWVDLAEPLVVQAGGGFVAAPAPAVTVRAETVADRDEVRAANRLAFGQDDEADLVAALRDGGYVRVSLVAEVDGRVVGRILFSDLSIVTTTGTVPALALAPMAVLPAFQHLGVRSALAQRGLDERRERGHRIVVVLGHPGYYPRLGFSHELESPFGGAEAFMAAELMSGALDGVEGRVAYAPPFGKWV